MKSIIGKLGDTKIRHQVEPLLKSNNQSDLELDPKEGVDTQNFFSMEAH